MNDFKLFIKNNYLSIAIGLFFYLLFLYYNSAGNSLCDCETTENYKPAQTNNGGRTHFYHK